MKGFFNKIIPFISIVFVGVGAAIQAFHDTKKTEELKELTSKINEVYNEVKK